VGFVLTLLYIVVTIISPTQFGPEWVDYHALVYLAALTALASLPSIATHANLKSSIQTYLLIGFIVAIGASQIANGWFGGALHSWLVFLPSAAVYFFIVANVTSTRRLKIVTMVSILSCLILVGEGMYGYYFGGVFGETFVMDFHYSGHEELVTQIPRLRGVGFLHDPNDFAQILLICIPLLFILWRRGQAIMNVLFVLLPAGVLLWATYLTHSRGALIGLAVLGLVAARNRLGTAPSIVLAGVLAMGLLAIDFTGGRGISASEGADRLEAWSTGLELFKHFPLFGVGFGNFTNFNEITAHNSFVLCLAELGIVGTTLWMALLITTTLGLNAILQPREETEITDGQNAIIALNDTEPLTGTASDLAFNAHEETLLPHNAAHIGDASSSEDFSPYVTVGGGESSVANVEYDARAQTLPFSLGGLPTMDDPEVDDRATKLEAEPANDPLVPAGWLVAIRLALIAFITTSWFLSRSYSTTMYLVLGLAAAAIALQPPGNETRDLPRWMFLTLTVELAAILFVYLVVRLRH
jgi:putative inorganic carbon (hco3(-)) transporter